MVERTKLITVEGSTFQLQKMPAAKAYAILVELLTKALPVDFLQSAMQDFLPAKLAQLPGKTAMSMEEMELLQLKLLASVKEQLPGGLTPIIDSQGNFQVEDLEDDMLLFGTLLLKAVEFQYADFFTALLSRLGISMDDPETVLQKLEVALSEQPMSANTSLAL